MEYDTGNRFESRPNSTVIYRVRTSLPRQSPRFEQHSEHVMSGVPSTLASPHFKNV